MGTVFHSRLNKILNNWFSPLLKSHSFKKRGETYIRTNHELAYLIDIQRSRWNDEREAQFTLNCGIYVPGVVSTYLHKTEPVKTKIEDCTLTARVGMLSDTQRDEWWLLCFDDEPEQEDERIGMDIQNQVKQIVLPFLARFETRDDIIDFLVSPRSKELRFVRPQSEAQCLAYAAILLSILGRPEKCTSILNAAIEVASNTPIQEVVSTLRDRIKGPKNCYSSA